MNIGEVRNVNGRLMGSIATRTIDLPKIGLRRVESDNPRAPKFEVVALNLDTRNPDRPPRWMQENGIARLAYYSDPAGRALPALQQGGDVVGLPTTFLIDPNGCEIGVMKGPAEWASEDALRLVRAALGRG